MTKFEINVSWKGEHYCRVALPNSLSEVDAKRRARLIIRAFKHEAEFKFMFGERTEVVEYHDIEELV